MINSSRKLIKAGELYQKLFDKFYKSNTAEIPNDNAMVGNDSVVVSDIVFPIIDKLRDETSKVIFLNRGKKPMDTSFIKAIPDSMACIDLTEQSEIYKGAKSPHYWTVTKKTGHWNVEAHAQIANTLVLILSEQLSMTQEYTVFAY
jgi:ribosomal protein S4E